MSDFKKSRPAHGNDEFFTWVTDRLLDLLNEGLIDIVQISPHKMEVHVKKKSPRGRKES